MAARLLNNAGGITGSYSPESRLRDYTKNTRETSKRAPMDLPFFLLVILLLTIGVIMVLSASFASAYYTKSETGGNPTYYFMKQLIFAVSGIFIMLVVSRVNVTFFRRMAFPLLALSVVMLILVAIPGVGLKLNGARRWFNLGFTTVQPSEIAKLAEILVFASLICKYRNKMKTFKYGVFPFVMIIAVLVGLLLLEPHLSASVIIILIGIVMMFIGGTRLGWFIGGGTVVGVGAVVVVNQFSHASSRIAAWLDPFAYAQNQGWQIIQSLYAIGSGGLAGVGLGQSRQKYLYLPEEHNDYIFAIVCEELGFVGAVMILALFAVLIIRGYWIALHARTRFASLVAAGITSMLAIQVFLNVGVVTNLLPSTGISLPFFSYGGTALWIQLIEMGIVLGISREIPAKKAG